MLGHSRGSPRPSRAKVISRTFVRVASSSTSMPRLPCAGRMLMSDVYSMQPLSPRPGVVVGAPEVVLPTAVFEEQGLFVGVQLATHRSDAAGDVHDILDHVLEMPLHQAAELGAIETGLDEDDVGLGALSSHGCQAPLYPGRSRGEPHSRRMTRSRLVEVTRP